MRPDPTLDARNERRRTGGAIRPAFAGTGDGTSLSAPAAAALHAAAERVAALWRPTDDVPAPNSEFDGGDQFSAVLRAVEGDADAVLDGAPTGADLNHRRRLLDALRSELVASWANAPVDAQVMIDLLEATERVRTTLEPDWRRHVSNRMLGPDGLELVVEVAHDLRSPLTSILFLSETLRRGQSGPVNEVQHRQLGLVYSAALGLISVVGDLIELARGGEELTDTEPAPFSISEILHSVSDIVKPMAEEKKLDLRIIPARFDRRLGFSMAVSRVLLNLTTNALKFTKDGFVEIMARELDGSRVEFSVRDTGTGIDADIMDTLYSPFRTSRSTKRCYFSGTGLGLSIAKKLVEAMDSELVLESRPAWGTRFAFVVELPPATHL